MEVEVPFGGCGDDGGYRRLWINIIVQAFKDLDGMGDEFDRLNAVNWFKRDGSDFRKACLLAGFDYAIVRQSALNIVNGTLKIPTLSRGKMAGNRNYPPILKRFEGIR